MNWEEISRRSYQKILGILLFLTDSGSWLISLLEVEDDMQSEANKEN